MSKDPKYSCKEQNYIILCTKKSGQQNRTYKQYSINRLLQNYPKKYSIQMEKHSQKQNESRKKYISSAFIQQLSTGYITSTLIRAKIFEMAHLNNANYILDKIVCFIPILGFHFSKTLKTAQDIYSSIKLQRSSQFVTKACPCITDWDGIAKEACQQILTINEKSVNTLLDCEKDFVKKLGERLCEVLKDASIADIMRKEYPSREEQFGASLGAKLMSKYVASGDLYKQDPFPTKQNTVAFLVKHGTIIINGWMKDLKQWEVQENKKDCQLM